jgi:tetratricopeptide (TPR) repeat protein
MRLAGTAMVAVVLLAAGAALAADPGGPSLLTAPPRSSQAKPHAADADAATYDRCMKLARENPTAARDLATDWQKRGGAHPADHCFAVALIGLKQYREAATRLEALAQAMIRAPAALRAEVLDQAGQAWLLAGDAARAYAADGAALELRPDDADLLTDRAEAAGSAGWFDKAVADLDRVLKTNPSRLDALVYRASANRALERLDPALADIDAALKLAPDSAEALLERGNIRRLKGDIPGARQDWLRVAKLAPGSAEEAAAKANIERLDRKDEPAPAATPGSRQ